MSDTIKFEKIIKTAPPFDKRHKNPAKNYGVGSMRVWFILRGPDGAVQFMLSTGAYLENVVQEWEDNGIGADSDGRVMYGFPTGWDLGYHSPKPIFEGQSSNDCDLLPGGKCYMDGSSLNGRDFLQKYIDGGDDGVWTGLQEYYKRIFK